MPTWSTRRARWGFRCGRLNDSFYSHRPLIVLRQFPKSASCRKRYLRAKLGILGERVMIERTSRPRHRIDPAAYEQAIREWAVPECLHQPIVARDSSAVADHVGEIIEILSPGRAPLVRPSRPPRPDLRLPIFQHPNIDALFQPLQVWVNPSYTRYRQAWRRALGDDAIHGKVLHHVYNRRTAKLRGFGFIRLAPISRSANSSSAFTEGWGVALNTPDYVARLNARGLRIQYADLGALMVMLDINLGGGVQEAFRLGQNLIEVPGKRPPQS